MAYNDSRNPLRALQKVIGNNIKVRLKDGTEYLGKLKEYDVYLNVILADCVETMKNVEVGKYDELFIRGNNILFIIP